MPTKYCGIIKEILQESPSIDLVDFLEVKLEIPRFKAEALASRIAQSGLLTEFKTQKTKRLLEKQDKTENSLIPSKNDYFPDSISEKEFEYSLTWLFKELGFEFDIKKNQAEFGLVFMAAKDGQRIAVQALKTPKTHRITEQIVLIVQQAQETHGCNRSIVVATSTFTPRAIVEADKRGIELWDTEALAQKISEVENKAEETQSRFPSFQGTLLQSLLNLAETKEFLIESKASRKHDLHLPGVKYPLLTFYAQSDVVTQCIFRVKYNEPVGESKGEEVIKYDDSGSRISPNDMQAYTLIVEYLEQFLE